MIPLGLRLTLQSGKEGIARLGIAASGIAIGVLLLLSMLAGITALQQQSARSGWSNISSTRYVKNAAHRPVWWSMAKDTYKNKPITRIDVGIISPGSPLPPGVAQLPKSGEYIASPALQHLITTSPHSDLGIRFAGTFAGTITEQGLSGPHALVIIVGHTASSMAKLADPSDAYNVNGNAPRLINTIENTPSFENNNTSLAYLAFICPVALLLPTIIFVGTATRLSAARREQRFAAMRLVGATPRQVNSIAATEASFMAIIGTVAGFGMFYTFRPLLARLPINSQGFFASELHLNTIAAVAILIAVPLISAIGALAGLRHVNISPLGIARRVTSGKLSAKRVIVFAVGVSGGIIFSLVSAVAPTSTTVLRIGMVGGLFSFSLAMLGLITAGPWLTQSLSRLMAKRVRTASGLIAARRMGDDSKAVYRAVSGTVIAVFMLSAFFCITTTLTNQADVAKGQIQQTGSKMQSLPPTTITLSFNFFNTIGGLAPQKAQLLESRIQAIPGTQRIVASYAAPLNLGGNTPELTSLIRCSDIEVLHAGHCSEPTMFAYQQDFYPIKNSTVWKSVANTNNPVINTMPLHGMTILNDGKNIERIRSTIIELLPSQEMPTTQTEQVQSSNRALFAVQRTLDVAALIMLVITGCSLAVSITGGILESKQAFTLLRLAGAPLSALNKAVLYEAAAPLFTASIIALAAGIGFGSLLLRVIRFPFHAPPLAYYLLVAAGVLVSLALSLLALPLLARVTVPSETRVE